MTPWIVIDFETASACDLTTAGAYRYSIDPTTEVLCLSYENHLGIRGTWWPGDPMPAPISTAITTGSFFVCHSAAFERNIWANQMEPEFSWPPLSVDRWHDTQARSLQVAVGASLDNVLKNLGLAQEKDHEGRRLTLALSNPPIVWEGVKGKKKRARRYPERTPEYMARIGEYCESDIGGQVAVHKRLGWLPPHERVIWELNQEVNDRGIPLDMDFVRQAQRVVNHGTAELALRFRALTGLNFTQDKKVREWCHAKGVMLPGLGKEIVAEWLGDDIDGELELSHSGASMPADVREALLIRQLVGSRSIKKLAAMQACVGYDGRARGVQRYHGTTPGRGTAQLFQPHNFPKGAVTIDGEAPDPQPLIDAIMTGDADWVESLYGPPVLAVVQALRHSIRAAPGRILVAGDYAGIQARTVLGVAGQTDKTELMAKGFDPYIDNACSIWPELPRPNWHGDFKAEVKEFKKLYAKQRGTGKNSVLGLGFQMGAPTYQFKYAKDQPIEFCEEVVRVYRKDWAPQVPKLWYAMQDAAVDAVHTGRRQETHGLVYYVKDDWLWLELPNGSTISYYSPKPVVREAPWSTAEKPDFRPAISYRVEKNGHMITRDAFGGQLTENAVMKIEREIMERGKRILNANGYPVILDVHDEIVCEPLVEKVDMKAFEEMMLDVEDWVKDFNIPVAVETWASPVYKK